MIGSTEIHRRFSFKPLNGSTKLQQEAMLLSFEDLENAILWANKGISETK